MLQIQMRSFTMTCPERILIPTQVCDFHPCFSCFHFSFSVLYFLSAVFLLSFYRPLKVVQFQCSILWFWSSYLLVLSAYFFRPLMTLLIFSHRSWWDDLWWRGARRGGRWKLSGQRLELQWVRELRRGQRRGRTPRERHAPRLHERKAPPEKNPCVYNSHFTHHISSADSISNRQQCQHTLHLQEDGDQGRD